MPTDPITDYLQKAPLTREQKAAVWDAFNGAADEESLANAIAPLKIPNPVKAAVWDLKADETSKVTAPDAAPMNFAMVNGERVAVDDSPQELTWGDTARRAVGAVTSAVVDPVIGVAKGAASTAFGLGKIAHDYTPLGAVSDAIAPGVFDQKPTGLEPTSLGQKLGFTAEQIAEFFVPVAGVAGKAAKAAEVAKSVGLTVAQGGSPTAAGVSGVLTAALPGGASVTQAAGALETSAQKSVAQALGATKEWAKSEAAKLAPDILKRGIGGSRPAMLTLAKETSKRVNADLNKAYQAATAAGESVRSDIIRGGIELSSDALKVKNANGALVVIPGTEKVVRRLDKLAKFVATLGDDIPVDRAAHVKRTWDKIVSKAGLFGPKAGASATDSADAWAIREASDNFRQLLNTNPTIETLNKESAFWTGLKNVLKETEKRTQAQNGGLIAAVSMSPGAVAGLATGGPAGAIVGGVLSRQFVKVMQSPQWKTQVAGPLKHAFADALASGQPGRIVAAANKILASLPARTATASTATATAQ